MVFSMVRAAAVSRQQLGKQFPGATDTNTAIEERRFLCGPCREVMTRSVGAMSSVQNCAGRKALLARALS
jgi:hypothetical protein